MAKGSKKSQKSKGDQPKSHQQQHEPTPAAPAPAATTSQAALRTSVTKPGGGDQLVRGRGGYRMELRTIPEHIKEVHAQPAKDGGRQIEVMSNFASFGAQLASRYYQYRVDFEPMIESSRCRRDLFKMYLEKNRASFPGHIEFDGGNDALSDEPMSKSGSKVETFQHPSDPSKPIKVTVKQAKTLPFVPISLMRYHNFAMKDFLRILGFFQIGISGSMVSKEMATPIGRHGMHMLRGYSTTVNVHEGNKLLVLFEYVHKILQTNNVLMMLARIKSQCGEQQNFKELFRASIVGKLVLTSYKKIVYRVEDVNYDMSPKSTFMSREGSAIKFSDYFKNNYNCTIKDMNQPLLQVVPNSKRRSAEGETREIYVIPELCNLAGLTEEQRNDRFVKKDLLLGSQISPDVRVQQLRELLAQLNSNERIVNKIKSLGYSYQKDPLSVKARILDPQRIAARDNDPKRPDTWPLANPSDSFDRVLMNKIRVDKPIKKLAIVISRPDLNSQEYIVRTLTDGFKRAGLSIGNMNIVPIARGDRAADYYNTLKELPPDTEAAVVVLTRQMKDRYDVVKKYASCERGLITQVVTNQLLQDERKARSAALKIAIQLAAKVGAEPWHMHMPYRSMMVCGYDTNHDTTNRGKSFGAFTATMNPSFSRYWSKAMAHDRKEELSTHIRDNMVQATKRWKQLNGQWPSRVYLYRDGVSEGQISHVFEVEVKEIKSGLEQLDKEIKLTVALVNKRIGARFFMPDRGHFTNCPPGTVIDNTVTRQERFDFYLISQKSGKGLVSPTYYNIIKDEIGFVPNLHQLLAYQLSHMYFNWTGTVRVPAPCQYAHKLAFLCGEHLHEPVHHTLDDRLHYL